MVGCAALAKRKRSKGPTELLEDDDLVEYWIDKQMGERKFKYVLEIVEQAMTYTRRPASILVWKALAHANLNQFGDAELAARAALERDPHSESGVITLATILLRTGRGDHAIDVCDEFLARHSNSDQVAKHKIDMARAVAKSARQHIRKFGPDGGALTQLANAYIQLGEYDAADRAYRKAAKLEPDVADHHFGIVMVAHLRHDEATAEEYLKALKSRDEVLAKRVEKAIEGFFEELKAGGR